MVYIQRKDLDTQQLETVGQFETRREARSMLIEYKLIGDNARYYTSARACKGWT